MLKKDTKDNINSVDEIQKNKAIFINYRRMKYMLTPQEFAQQCELSYQQVLQMCKNKEISALKTEGGHFKIPEKELDIFKNSGYVTKEEYLRVIRENEKLKTIIKNCMNLLSATNNL